MKGLGGCRFLLLAIGSTWGTTAGAAEPDPVQIVVTAQKRQQAAGQVGIAVTALDRSATAALARQDMAAIARDVTGLQVLAYSPTLTVFNIRGVSQNDYADSQEAPVAFYQDEVYGSALGAIAGRGYDLARIEVLRGPQGTLFGRNATGGLVHFISAPPPDAFEARASGTAGRYRQLAGDGAIGGPLTPSLRARASFSADTHRGWIANRAGADLGGARFYAGRLQLAADLAPGHDLAVKLEGLRNAHERSAGLYSHAAAAPDARGLGRLLRSDEDAFGTCAGCDALGYREPDADPFTGAFNDPIRFDRRFLDASARYSGEFGGVTLTSISDWQHLRKNYAEDSDMSPVSALTNDAFQRLSQASQEVRLEHAGERLRWVAGGYALRIRSVDRYRVDASGSLGIVEDYGGRLATDSVAGFAQGEYLALPGWTLIAGARYTHDRKLYTFDHAENGVRDLAFDAATQPTLADRGFGAWSWKAQLDWRPTDTLLVYAGVDRGTKSGGYSAPALAPADPATIAFDAETLTSYSAGAKATFAHGRAQAALAVFRYDYRGYQAFELVDLALAVRNKDATTTGVEFEMSASPAAGLTLAGSVAWLDATVKRVVLPLGDIVDRRMPQAPRWSAVARARYAFPLGRGEGAMEARGKYDGVQYLSAFNAEVDRAKARLVADVRLDYTTPNRRMTLTAFADNLTKRRYKTFNLDFSTSFGFAQTAYARPRWFGLTLTARSGS